MRTVILTVVVSVSLLGQANPPSGGGGGGGGVPSGSAGGDLSGTYPNPGVGKVNGGSVPVSASVLGSNSSSQPIAATAHSLAAIRTCSAASSSATAYTCTTSPTFTPATGDQILFKADVANSGSATLNVNSSSAITIKKQGGGTNLAANDLLIGTWTPLTYDGTNWQMQGQTGNVPSSITVAQGVIASLPSCNSSLNEIYYPTDSYYPQVNCLSGASSWTYLREGQQFFPPTAASTWTLVNGGSGSATKADSSGAVKLSTSVPVIGIEAILKAIPSAPYTKTIAIRYVNGLGSGANGTNSDLARCGALLTNGTATSSAVQVVGPAMVWPSSGGQQTNNVMVAHYSNFTFSGAALDSQLTASMGLVGNGTLWIRFADDSTTRTLSVSSDGVNYLTMLSGARTAPFTPTNYGVFCGDQNGLTATTLGWTLTLLSDN